MASQTWNADVWLLDSADTATESVIFILTVQAATNAPDYTFTVKPRYDAHPDGFAHISTDPATEAVASSVMRTAQELIGYDYTKLLSDILPNYRTAWMDLAPTVHDTFQIYGIWGQYYTRLRIRQQECVFFSIMHLDEVNHSDGNTTVMRVHRNMLLSHFPKDGPNILIDDLPSLVTLPEPHPLLFPNGHLEAHPNGSLNANTAEQLILFLTSAVNNPYVQEQMEKGLLVIPEPYMALKYHR